VEYSHFGDSNTTPAMASMGMALADVTSCLIRPMMDFRECKAEAGKAATSQKVRITAFMIPTGTRSDYWSSVTHYRRTQHACV
jgi:hypothetical protein